MGEPNRIIPFTARDERPPVSLKPRDWDACQHKGPILVDEINRTVECDGCKTLLDPVMVLVQMANGYRLQTYQIEQLREYEEKMARHNERERERRAKRRQRDEAKGIQWHVEGEDAPRAPATGARDGGQDAKCGPARPIDG